MTSPGEIAAEIVANWEASGAGYGDLEDRIESALREAVEPYEDFRHDMALQAYCAPAADFDSIRESLSSRIADLTKSREARPRCSGETFRTGTGLAGRCVKADGHSGEHSVGGSW